MPALILALNPRIDAEWRVDDVQWAGKNNVHSAAGNCSEGFQFAATPPRVKPRKTVGAGDALLAAVARQIELVAPPQAWLWSGLGVGTLATQSQPGRLPPLSALHHEAQVVAAASG